MHGAVRSKLRMKGSGHEVGFLHEDRSPTEFSENLHAGPNSINHRGPNENHLQVVTSVSLLVPKKTSLASCRP